MVFPSILYLFVLSYLPMVGIYYAFTNYNYQGGLFGSPFVDLLISSSCLPPVPHGN